MIDEAHEREAFQVGGTDTPLTPEEQLEQLSTYIDAHYPLPDFRPPWAGGSGDPAPADLWSGKLPDRITHASMLMLGAGLDHSMPGAAYAQGIAVEERGDWAIFRPAEPTGVWAITLHSGGWWRGSGDSLEFQWRPEVAAGAALSGATVLDIDYPLAPEHSLADIVAAVGKAVDYARSQGATHIAMWGYSSGGALAVMAAQAHDADALVLTFPDLGGVAKLPDDIRAGYSVPPLAEWPEHRLVQVATKDGVAEDPQVPGERFYVSTHRVSTPEVARQRVRDAAEFLRSLAQQG